MSSEVLQDLRWGEFVSRPGYGRSGWERGGSLAALQAVLGHGTIAVTERYGTIGDDLVEREVCVSPNAVRREAFGEKWDQAPYACS